MRTRRYGRRWPVSSCSGMVAMGGPTERLDATDGLRECEPPRRGEGVPRLGGRALETELERELAPPGDIGTAMLYLSRQTQLSVTRTHLRNRSSEGSVSGWTEMPWAKRCEVERDGSELAGSSSEPPLTGRHAAPPPIVEATSVGTMAMSDEGWMPAASRRADRDLSTKDDERIRPPAIESARRPQHRTTHP